MNFLMNAKLKKRQSKKINEREIEEINKMGLFSAIKHIKEK
jgi:hypothetical protein